MDSYCLCRGDTWLGSWTRSCVPHGRAPSPPVAGLPDGGGGAACSAGAGPGRARDHTNATRGRGAEGPSAIWCLKEKHPYVRVK